MIVFGAAFDETPNGSQFLRSRKTDVFGRLHEIEKARKRAELEKEEIQLALEEAESALEQEEAKVLRAQMELSTVRQEIDRRIHEKEEEFETTRRNHSRALESMQASLEAENRAKAEALKQVSRSTRVPCCSAFSSRASRKRNSNRTSMNSNPHSIIRIAQTPICKSHSSDFNNR